jgi:alpha-1,2-mannosyltransferase
MANLDMTAELTIPAPRNTSAELFFKIAFAMGVLVAGLEIGYLIYSPLPYDPLGYLVGRDFVNTWLGGQLALTGDPGAYFGPEAYNGLLKERFGPSYPHHIWSYPPTFLLFTWPFALMPYIAAYVLYSLIGLVVYLAVATEGRPRADKILLLIFAPAVIVNLWCGQTGFFVAALLIGGLIALERRPILAGVLFGLLSIKPQLGLLIPVMLVLTGRWRTIAAASATIAVLVAAASLAFGPKVWVAYVNDAMPAQTALIARDFEHFMVHMPTVFMSARVAGASMSVAIWAQVFVSAIAVVAVIWTFWRRREPELSNMLFVTATFLATPYAFNYDMVVFGWVAIKLMERSDADAWDYLLMLAVWATPFMTVPSGMAGLPVSVLPMLAFGGRLIWRIWQAERQCGGHTTTTAGLAPAAPQTARP